MAALSQSSRFRYPCYRDLKRELGELDATCENVELAVRELIERAVAAENQNEADARATRALLLESMSSKYGVRVGTLDAPVLRWHVVHLYLMSVHQGLENFLISLKEEHPDGAAWKMDGDDDRLTKVARNLTLEHSLAYDLCQYYRGVRNSFAHPRAKPPNPEKLRRRVENDRRFDRLEAPHGFTSLTFDDFVLYTRCAKGIAEEMCAAGRPSSQVLAAIAEKYASESGAMRRLAGSPQRLMKAKSGYLQTTYSVSPAEADAILELRGVR
jgi:hypothetical protein